ncbi:unnamed protein product, partial [Ilex paraguariensis]
GTRIKTRKRNIAAPLDPAAFADAVVQIYLDNAGDLSLQCYTQWDSVFDITYDSYCVCVEMVGNQRLCFKVMKLLYNGMRIGWLIPKGINGSGWSNLVELIRKMIIIGGNQGRCLEKQRGEGISFIADARTYLGAFGQNSEFSGKLTPFQADKAKRVLEFCNEKSELLKDRLELPTKPRIAKVDEGIVCINEILSEMDALSEAIG